jgi:hypothetical protein
MIFFKYEELNLIDRRNKNKINQTTKNEKVAVGVVRKSSSYKFFCHQSKRKKDSAVLGASCGSRRAGAAHYCPWGSPLLPP